MSMEQGNDGRSPEILFAIIVIFFLGALTGDFGLLDRCVVVHGSSFPLGTGGRSLGLAGCRSPVLAEATFALLQGGDFVGGQESASRSTRSSHGVVMSRLVEVRFATLRGEAELLLELLSSNAALKDAMELFGVHIQWGLLGSSHNNLLLGSLNRLLRRHHGRGHRLPGHVMIHDRL